MDPPRHLRLVPPDAAVAAVVPLAAWRAQRPAAGTAAAYLSRRAVEQAVVAAVDRVLDRVDARPDGRLPLARAAEAVRRGRES